MVFDPSRGTRALRRGRVSEPARVYVVTAVCARRFPWFASWEAAREVGALHIDPSAFPDVEVLAWVLMPDHWHALLTLRAEASLSAAVQRFKSLSARRANGVIGRSGAVWQRGFHDRALRRDEDLRSAGRYLVANPIRAGLVRRAGDCPFWDCVWL
jgi:REP element-mobilizing transposase RayT